MNTQLFDRFAPVIRSLSPAELEGAASLDARLRLAQDGPIEVCYAPFEFVNPHARVVVVGITPGRTQMLNAIREARRQLDRGADAPTALRAAKQAGAFSGAMRPNLVDLLDAIGLHRWLGLGSCEALFGAAGHLVQTASVLRNPVFVAGANYRGTPDMTCHPLLREQLLTHFGQDAARFGNAMFVPLGDKVAKALDFLADQGLLDHSRILEGLPHPSGANAERIAYFLGRKQRGSLSVRTRPDRIDRARDRLVRQVAALAWPLALVTAALEKGFWCKCAV